MKYFPKLNNKIEILYATPKHGSPSLHIRYLSLLNFLGMADKF